MRINHLFVVLAIVLSVGAATPGFAAGPAGTPSAFVAEIADRAIFSANSRTLTAAERQSRFEAVLDEGFDVPRIATFVLGRYWHKASAVQQRDFTAVVRDVILRITSQYFTEHGGTSFRVVGIGAVSAAGTIVFTENSESSSAQATKVGWNVSGTDVYRITDLSIGGISMATLKRDEFTSFLQRNGGDLTGLIQQLQTRISAK